MRKSGFLFEADCWLIFLSDALYQPENLMFPDLFPPKADSMLLFWFDNIFSDFQAVGRQYQVKFKR